MKTQLSKPAQSKARYTEEYKKEALELWRNSGRSAKSRRQCSSSDECTHMTCAQPGEKSVERPFSRPVDQQIKDYHDLRIF